MPWSRSPARIMRDFIHPRPKLRRMGRRTHVFYTVDTVRRFHREHPDDHLFFILGADQFLEIPTWKNYEALARCCDFIIASRPGFRLDALRLVIPPEKLGRTASPDPQNDCAAQIRDSSSYDRLEPHLLDGNPAPARTPADHSRACARARRGIHSGTGPVPVTLNSLRPEIRSAVEAAQDKQAVDITVLNLSGAGAFAEYFLLCSGQSQPQIQAIGEAIEEKLLPPGTPRGASRRKIQRRMGAARLRRFRCAHFQRTRAAVLRPRTTLALRRARDFPAAVCSSPHLRSTAEGDATQQ